MLNLRIVYKYLVCYTLLYQIEQQYDWRSDWMNITLNSPQAIESLREKTATDERENRLLEAFRQADERKKEIILRFAQQLIK